jgi:hypothetical protein
MALFLPGATARAETKPSNAKVIPDQVSETAIVLKDEPMLSTASDPGSYRPLSGRERWNLYLHDALWSPGIVFRVAGPALLGAQVNDEPPAWGQGAEGYSRRFGRFALKETYEAAGAAALGHEVRYVRSMRTVPCAAHGLSSD